MKNPEGRKSRDTVPLISLPGDLLANENLFIYYRINAILWQLEKEILSPIAFWKVLTPDLHFCLVRSISNG
jgi:hypothetical protein